MALTPVAVLMFRFNNPDALLVLLLVLAAYACVRAVEHEHPVAGHRRCLGRTRLSHQDAQAFLVVPGFALTYLIAAPTVCGAAFGSCSSPGSPCC
jgi:4-amino-4-deoxy-L-arabinose transferase-like glycosyltransferase